jgi:amidohydrolase
LAWVGLFYSQAAHHASARRNSVTVVDSRDRSEGAKDLREHDMLLTDTGVSMAPVHDFGAGRGPSWLDGWLAGNLVDLLAWRRHIHANPELSRREFGTTELVAKILTSAGLEPRILPGGTGLICDVGTGRSCVALRADLDALPLAEVTDLDFRSTVEGVCHACGHDMHTAALLGAGLALAAAP